MSQSNGRPWYHQGLRFQCAGCGGCCTGAPGYVWVNHSEIRVLAAAVGLDIEAFQSRYVRSVGIRKSLIELANGDCIFFDNTSRKCTVYKSRPRQCRTWPFWSSNLQSPEAWNRMCGHCPGGNRGPLVPLEKIQASLAMVHI